MSIDPALMAARGQAPPMDPSLEAAQNSIDPALDPNTPPSPAEMEALAALDEQRRGQNTGPMDPALEAAKSQAAPPEPLPGLTQGSIVDEII